MLRWCFFYLCLFTWLLFGVMESWAQDPVIEIDKITVTAKSENSLKNTSTLSVDIPVPEAGLLQTVADLVAEVPGVHMNRHGGLQEFVDVSIRGSTHQQVQVFLDGIPLETASGQGIGLSQIFLGGLDKIQIYKFFSPTEIGRDAIGGVISISSKPIAPGFSHRYSLGAGSFKTLQALAELSYGGKKNQFSFTTRYYFTEGDFKFLDDNGTPVYKDDDEKVVRQNNQQQVISPSFKWRHQLSDTTDLTWTSHFFHTKQGVPGWQSFQSEEAKKSSVEFLSNLKLTQKDWCHSHCTVSQEIYTRVIQSEFSDPQGEIGLGNAQDNQNRIFILGTRSFFDYKTDSFFSLKSALEYSFESFLPRDFLSEDPTGSLSMRHYLSVAVEPSIDLFDKKLSLGSQIKTQHSFYNINNDDPSLNDRATFFDQSNENQFSGKLYANYSWRDFLIKASGGRAVRLPKFTELFGDQGNVLGNPQLQSEIAWQFDLSLSWQKKWQQNFINKIYLEGTYFQSDLDDLIQFELINGIAQADNIGSAKVRGSEWVASLHFAKHFIWKNSYTVQFARQLDTKPQRYLIGRPQHEINSTLSFFYKNFEAQFGTHFIDKQFLDSLNTQVIRNRFLLDLGLSYSWQDKYKFSLEFKNLTNSQVVDVIGYPLPGRGFFAKIDALFF